MNAPFWGQLLEVAINDCPFCSEEASEMRFHIHGYLRIIIFCILFVFLEGSSSLSWQTKDDMDCKCLDRKTSWLTIVMVSIFFHIFVYSKKYIFMRKILLIITLVLATSFSAKAQSVPESVATRKAASFLHIKSETQLTLLKSPYETFYLYALKEGGFVIVSADYRVQPILGYSQHSKINVENIPSNMAAWLDGYDKQIRAAMEDDDLPVHEGWQEQAMPKTGVEGYDSIVGPLLTTTWNQLPYYNDQCPLYGGERTYTGCVATAMAQVMKYWNWPDVGVGQHSYYDYRYGTLSANFSIAYDWDSMPAALSSSSSTAQVDAVATLMYHCGVAVEMDYGTLTHNGSGAYDIMTNRGLNFPCAENALRSYFKYTPALRGIKRTNFSGSEWVALIKNDIDHRRPILYGGTDVMLGHEFICDGYDTNGLFHINWGYGGDGDGYFTFTNLTIADYNFCNNQTAVIGIEPDTLYGSSTTCTVTATSADTAKGNVLGGGTYTYRDTVNIVARPANGYRFLHWNNGSHINPYPFLAHDAELTAYFTNALAENGDTLSYTGTNASNRGTFTHANTNRAGIKIPASVLSGHKYLNAVDLYHYFGKYVVYVHCGGDDAPGSVVYTQPFEITDNNMGWHRAFFETPIPIDTNNNLWITIRFMNESISYMGIPHLDIPDGNWISTDNGETWRHLNQIEPNTSRDDTSICWFVRCITSQDSVAPTGFNSTAYLNAPEYSNVGDTVQVELVHSTYSSVEWDFGDAEVLHVDSDTAFVIWNTTGVHTVEAQVEGIYDSVTISISIVIADCGTPVSTYPYNVSFSQQDAVRRVCWQLLHYGEGSGYYYGNNNDDYMAVLISGRTDDWFVSPLIDLNGDEPLWLDLKHLTSNCNITVELSQGGLDSSDFTAICTLPDVSSVTSIQPINLSEYYQGNLIRLALRMRPAPNASSPRFEFHGLRIGYALGIDDVGNATLSVYPNPFRQLVSVTLPAPNGTLSIYSMTGRQILQRHVSSYETVIDASTLPIGVYLLQYTSARGTYTTRIVVQ